MKKKRVFITEPGWFLAKNGKAVSIQYWDYNFWPAKDAPWRGMVVVEAETRTIVDWKCLWYTVHGEGHFPDSWQINMGDWDIVRPLQPEEIPVDKPDAWMPGYDERVRQNLKRKNPTRSKQVLEKR